MIDRFRNERNSFRQDYLQSLYAFKSKQVHGESAGVAAHRDKANLTFLTRAASKYADAATIDPNNAEFHFAAGRVLAALGKPDEARERFQAVWGIKPAHPQVRLYLAVTALLCGPGTTIDGLDIVTAAVEELSDFLQARTLSQLLPSQSTEDRHRPDVVLVKGFTAARNALLAKKRHRECARLCNGGVILVRSLMFPMTNRGSDTYLTLESTLLAMHLGIIKSQWAAGKKDNAAMIARNTASLAASLSTSSSVGLRLQSEQLLKTALQAAPQHPILAIQLGHHLLREADGLLTVQKATVLLEDATRCFQSVIALEAGADGTTKASELLGAQSWWREKLLPEPAAPKGGKKAAPMQGKNQLKSVPRTDNARGRGQQPKAGPRKMPAASTPTRGAAVPRSTRPVRSSEARGTQKATPFRKSQKPLPAIGAGANRGGSEPQKAAARGGTRAPLAGASESQKAAARGGTRQPAAKPPKVSEDHLVPAAKADVATAIDPTCAYNARIGLARTARLEQKLAGDSDTDKTTQIEAHCRDAIKLNPDKHDA